MTQKPKKLTPEEQSDKLWNIEAKAAEDILGWLEMLEKLCKLAHSAPPDELVKILRSIDRDQLARVQIKLMEILGTRFALERDTINARIKNTASASEPRKLVTKDELLAFKARWMAGRGGRERGWMKAACLEFGIDQKTLKERMRE